MDRPFDFKKAIGKKSKKTISKKEKKEEKEDKEADKEYSDFNILIDQRQYITKKIYSKLSDILQGLYQSIGTANLEIVNCLRLIKPINDLDYTNSRSRLNLILGKYLEQQRSMITDKALGLSRNQKEAVENFIRKIKERTDDYYNELKNLIKEYNKTLDAHPQEYLIARTNLLSIQSYNSSNLIIKQYLEKDLLLDDNMLKSLSDANLADALIYNKYSKFNKIQVKHSVIEEKSSLEKAQVNMKSIAEIRNEIKDLKNFIDSIDEETKESMIEKREDTMLSLIAHAKKHKSELINTLISYNYTNLTANEFMILIKNLPILLFINEYQQNEISPFEYRFKLPGEFSRLFNSLPSREQRLKLIYIFYNGTANLNNCDAIGCIAAATETTVNGNFCDLHHEMYKYEKPEECSICNEKFEENVVPIICGHWFHKKCIEHWTTNYKNECPICKKEVKFIEEQAFVRNVDLLETKSFTTIFNSIYNTYFTDYKIPDYLISERLDEINKMSIGELLNLDDAELLIYRSYIIHKLQTGHYTNNVNNTLKYELIAMYNELLSNKNYTLDFVEGILKLIKITHKHECSIQDDIHLFGINLPGIYQSYDKYFCAYHKPIVSKMQYDVIDITYDDFILPKTEEGVKVITKIIHNGHIGKNMDTRLYLSKMIGAKIPESYNDDIKNAIETIDQEDMFNMIPIDISAMENELIDYQNYNILGENVSLILDNLSVYGINASGFFTFPDGTKINIIKHLENVVVELKRELDAKLTENLTNIIGFEPPKNLEDLLDNDDLSIVVKDQIEEKIKESIDLKEKLDTLIQQFKQSTLTTERKRQIDNIFKDILNKNHPNFEKTDETYDIISKEIWDEMIQNNLMTVEEYNNYLSFNTRLTGVINKYVGKKRDNKLSKVLQKIPVNIQNIIDTKLQKVMKDLHINIGRDEEINKDNSQNYYKFIVGLVALSKNNPENINEFILTYSDILGMEYINIVKDYLKNSDKITFGNDLIKLTSNYLKKFTISIKNPLQVDFTKRRTRYLKTQPTIAEIYKPTIYDKNPVVQSNYNLYKLRPWVEISNLYKYRLVIAPEANKTYMDLSAEEKKYFNDTLIVSVDDLNFYKPTNYFWYNRKDNFLDSAGNPRFNEMLYNKDQNLSIKLYNDQEVYIKELNWLNDRKKSVNEIVEEYIQKDISKNKNVRNQAISLFSNVLNDLRILYGTGNVTLHSGDIPKDFTRYDITFGKEYNLPPKNDLKSLKMNHNNIKDAVELEKSFYEYCKSTGKNLVSEYLNELYKFLVFTDVNYLGKQAIYFTNLLAFSSYKFYPNLWTKYNSLDSRFPEYVLKQDANLDLLRNYVDTLVQYQIQKYVINTLNFDESIIDINQPEIPSVLTSDISLKNICINGKDYESYDNSELIYYKYKNDVFCIPKFEIAKLAVSDVKDPKIGDISISQELLNEYRDYIDYKRNELMLQTNYFTFIINTISHDTNIYLNEKNRNIFEEFVLASPENREIYMDKIISVFPELGIPVNKPIGRLLIPKAYEMIREFRFKTIFSLANDFINKNFIESLDKETLYELTIKHLENLGFNLTDKGVNKYQELENGIVHRNIRSLINRLYTKPVQSNNPIQYCSYCKKVPIKIDYKTVIYDYKEKKNIDLYFCCMECLNLYKFTEPTKKEASGMRSDYHIKHLYAKPNINHNDLKILANKLGTSTDWYDIILHPKYIPTEAMLFNRLDSISYLTLKYLGINARDTDYYKNNVHELYELWYKLRESSTIRKLIKDITGHVVLSEPVDLNPEDAVLKSNIKTLFFPIPISIDVIKSKASELNIKGNNIHELYTKLVLDNRYQYPIIFILNKARIDLLEEIAKSLEIKHDDLRAAPKISKRGLAGRKLFNEKLVSDLLNQVRSHKKFIQIMTDNRLEFRPIDFGGDIYLTVKEDTLNYLKSLKNLEEILANENKFIQFYDGMYKFIFKNYPTIRLNSGDNFKTLKETYNNFMKAIMEFYQQVRIHKKVSQLTTEWSLDKLISFINSTCNENYDLESFIKASLKVIEITPQQKITYEHIADTFERYINSKLFADPIKCRNLIKILNDYRDDYQTITRLEIIFNNSLAEVLGANYIDDEEIEKYKKLYSKYALEKLESDIVKYFKHIINEDENMLRRALSPREFRLWQDIAKGNITIYQGNYINLLKTSGLYNPNLHSLPEEIKIYNFGATKRQILEYIKNFRKYIITKGKVKKPVVPESFIKFVSTTGDRIKPVNAFNLIEEENIEELRNNVDVEVERDEEIGGFIEEEYVLEKDAGEKDYDEI